MFEWVIQQIECRKQGDRHKIWGYFGLNITAGDSYETYSFITIGLTMCRQYQIYCGQYQKSLISNKALGNKQ